MRKVKDQKWYKRLESPGVDMIVGQPIAVEPPVSYERDPGLDIANQADKTLKQLKRPRDRF